MKTWKQFAAWTAFAALPFFLFAQTCPPATSENDGQKIVVKQGNNTLGEGGKDGLATPLVSSNRSFTFEHRDSKYTIPNYDCKDNKNCSVCGWYKGFWIFGDGNYKKYQNDVSRMDVDSRKTTYTYARRGIYEPVVYLTERYHNSTRPDAARAKVDLNSSTAPATPATDSPVLIDPATKRAAIDYNHNMRTDYPTVFVLSGMQDGNNVGLLFFYNSLQSSTGRHASSVMTHEKTEMPNYFERPLATVPNYNNNNNINDPQSYLSFLHGGIFDRLQGQFGNCLTYFFEENSFNSATAEGLNEVRTFPVMKTNAFGTGAIPAEPTVVLSLLISLKPAPDETISALREQMIEFFGDDDILSTLGDNLSISTGFGNELATRYIVGMATQSIAVSASHDPNNLFVKDIDTLQNDRYNVTFSLRICNQGEMDETMPSISIQDLTMGHYAAQPVLLTPMTNVTVSWRMEPNVKTVTLDGFVIPMLPPDHQPRCKFVDFSIETDAAGVAQLYQDSPRALRACVTFAGAVVGTEPDCSENDVLMDAPPHPGPHPDPNSDCWLLLFLALLILILLIYAWYNNQQPS